MEVNLVEQGRIESITERGVTVFKGVPFAAPPTGVNRWEPPKPPTPWTGVRKADKFGASCPQPVVDLGDGTEPVGEMSEDCLFLNVWTPETAVNPGARRPVMVWIHGGAFKIGEGRSKMYDGGPLAKKGAVVVTFNYRVGFLGFFTHSALERPKINTPINFGLLDQIAALNWVKANIASFGGDPSNVTIFGESAGAMSVLSLMASPMAAGLFHKAIAESPYAVPERSREGARKLCEGVANDVWKVPHGATPAQLRAVPVEVFKLAHVAGHPTTPIPTLAPSAVYGDMVLPEKVRVAFEDQTQHAVPLIIGSNSNEQSVVSAFGMKPELVYNLILSLPGGEEMLEQLKDLYRSDDLEDGAIDDPERFGGLILRDLLFTMQVRSLATWLAQKGQDVFRYYFKYVTEALRPKRPHGVNHGDEIVYAFNSGDLVYNNPELGEFTAQDRKIADAVSNYWVSFARDGKPVDARLKVAWNKHTTQREDVPWYLRADQILLIDDKLDLWTNKFMMIRLGVYESKYAELEPLIEAILNGELPPGR